MYESACGGRGRKREEREEVCGAVCGEGEFFNEFCKEIP